MARQEGSMILPGNVELKAIAPLDARTVVDAKADLTVAANFEYPYEGLPVYVKAEKKYYVLSELPVTTAANWKPLEGGSGGTPEWDDILNKPADLVEDADYVHTDNNYTDADKAKLDDLAEIKTVGDGLTLSAAGELSADEQTFVAEYQVTTAQEIIEYLDRAGQAPLLVKRGNDYYTAILAQKVNDTRVSIRALGTLSGSYYVFTYTVTNGTWSSASHGLQNLLVSGTNIKTVNGESLLGSEDIELATAADLDGKQDALTAGQNISIVKDTQTGETVISATGDVSVAWNEITGKPDDLVQDADYVHTDNNFSDAEKEKIARAQSAITTIEGAIGNLEDLTTEDKSNLVAALEETRLTASLADQALGEEILKKQDKLTAGDGITITKDTQTGETVIASTGGVTVDADLDRTSANPVQNKTITAVIESMTVEFNLLKERIVALETALFGFEETRLQMSDGTTTVDKTILAKPYVDPTTMFDLPAGAYDANGNLLAAANEIFSRVFEIEADENTVDLYALDVSKLPAGTVGMIFPTMSDDSPPRDVTGVHNYTGRYFIENGTLEWLVFPANYSITTNLATPATMVSIIYYNGDDVDAPWGQTSATINTTGTPLAWA